MKNEETNTMNPTELNRRCLRGWHTWNVRSVLSHVHFPDGFALNVAFKECRDGLYLKEALVGRAPGNDVETAFPGAHAFDDGITEMTLRWCDMEFRIESAVDGDDLVLLVTPVRQQVRPAMLVLESGFLWGKPGWTERNGQTLIGHCAAGDRVVHIVGTPVSDPNIPVQTACLCVSTEGPVAVSTGAERTLEEVRAVIEARRAAHAEQCARFGKEAPLYEAVESALAWDTVYDAKHDRVLSPVSRIWSIWNGGYVLFCWDNFFAGFMAALGSRELADSNLLAIFSERAPAGFVPNMVKATGQITADRSQPPVGSTMLLETYRIHREKWLVEEMYDGLLRWNQWFAEHRMNASGALCWGSEAIPVLYGNRWESDGVHARFAAALESGLDNSPMYDDVPFNGETNRLELEDVGLTGLYILDCRSLMELARLIGREADLPELRRRMDAARAGLETLWDEENGFYYNRRTDTGEFSRRISPTNFYALFSPDVSPARQRRMADEHYFNPKEFYGNWMLPSIARNDPAYPDQDYWRGRVWAPMNFLVYLALMRTDLDDVRKDLAQKSVDLFLKEWTEHRHVHENYSAETGEGCDVANSDKFYHWGALLAVVGLAEAGHIPGFGLPLQDAE